MQRLAALLVWFLILLTAGLPLAWLLLALLANAGIAAAHLAPNSYNAGIFARTLLLAAGGATVATLLAIPPAALLARWRLAGVVLLPIMASLLAMPQPAWAYGWSEVLLQALGLPAPASALDLTRVAITNATAWWPIPAAAIALAWRRVPGAILDHATLDGARGRITARLLVGPAIAGWSAALLLGAQNLSAPDQTAIVVAAVVVRDTLSTGGEVVLASQSTRIAAAIAAGLPSFLATAGLGIIGWFIFRRSVDWSREEDLEERQARGSGPEWKRGMAGLYPLWTGVTGLIVLGAVVPPLLGLVRTNDGLDVMAAVQVHRESLAQGTQLAVGSAFVCAALALLGVVARTRAPMVLSLACFLIGGQFLALGLIRAFLPPQGAPRIWRGILGAIYDTGPFYISIAACVALFAWLPLAIVAITWSGRWRHLRDLAAADGAGPVQSAAYVVMPLAWPGLLGATLAVFALSLTESQATALLVPGTPTNFMLFNIHTLNYPAMAEAALLMMLLVGGGVAVVVLAWQLIAAAAGRHNARPLIGRVGGLPCIVICGLLASCDGPAETPVAVWSQSGGADGQLVYPRALAYSRADDTVWVVDKTARVQQFDAEGNRIGGWTMPEQKFGKPVGISTDSEGNVWVADTHYYRVIVYRPDGTEWFRFGEQGIGPGQFVWPTDVVVLDDGRVLVSEYGSGGTDMPSHDRIQVFERSAEGTITDPAKQVIGQIGSFGTGPGQFRRPQSMVMIGEVLWVTDATNHRLLAFALDGTLLRSLGGKAGSAPGEFRFPYGLDRDNDGNLLVSEFGNHRVQKIDPETGRCLGTWGGSFGARPGQVKYPWGLAYDPKRDRVILLDSGNDRMQVIQISDTTAGPAR